MHASQLRAQGNTPSQESQSEPYSSAAEASSEATPSIAESSPVENMSESPQAAEPQLSAEEKAQK